MRRTVPPCGGNITSVGWQVTLCDPIWHVSSRSGVATLRTAIHLLLTYPTAGQIDQPCIWSSKWQLQFNAEMQSCMLATLLQRNFMMEGASKKKLDSVQHERGLGIIMSSNLKPSQQCIKAATTARRIVGDLM